MSDADAAPAAPDAVQAEPGSPPAFAVLTQRRGPLIAGQLVYADVSAIAAVVAAGGARDATPAEIERAAPFHFPLPEA